MLNENIYARVINNKIAEYPVLERYIKGRRLPLSMFKKVTYTEKPSIDKFHTLKEILEIKENEIICTYKVIPLSLNNILTAITINPRNSLLKDTSIKVNVNEIDSDTVNKIIELINARAAQSLLDFVKLRGYDSVESAISYKNSSVKEFVADANKVSSLRDNLWLAMHHYTDGILDGSIDFPTSLSDVDDAIPDLTW